MARDPGSAVSGPAPVVFFELGGALGFETAGADGTRLAGFQPAFGIESVLQDLGSRARIGVIASDPQLDARRVARVLAATKLDALSDPALVVVADRDAATAVFEQALLAAGFRGAPERAIYVGLDAFQRVQALRAGLRAAPHPLLAAAVLDGEPLHYVRLAALPAELGASSLDAPLVPQLVLAQPHAALYGVAPRSALSTLTALPVVGLPGDAAATSLYLFQATPEEVARSERLRAFLDELRSDDRLQVLDDMRGGLVVAVPGEISIDELHPPDTGHGHTLAAQSSSGLLLQSAATGGFALRSLSSAETAAFAQLDASLYGGYLAPCIGQTPIATTSGPMSIASRHSAHPDNALATAWLAAELTRICGSGLRLPLLYAGFGGAVLANVWADISGTTNELVIVAAHLDSTAANTPGYTNSEAVQGAPGVDDDASGVAGVLAAAHVLAQLAQTVTPLRTLRFVLFNAEEQGMKGSIHHAEVLKQAGVPIAAMLQMDMIGWVSSPHPPGVFEIHGTGSANYSAVYAPCRQLTALVAGAAAQVSPGLVAQSYPLPGSTTDPATHRSDHDSFQVQGWPACLVAEDLFSDVAASGAQTGNPDYHTQQDVAVNSGYAADVARAVAAAAWMIANPSTAAAPPPPSSPRRMTGAPAGAQPIAIVHAPPAASRRSNRRTAMANNEPIPTKYLVEFLAAWIRDENLRCKVLHQELTELRAYQLNDYQINALMSLDKQKILDRLAMELEQFLDIDMAKLQQEVGGLTPIGTGGSGGMGGGTIVTPQPVVVTSPSGSRIFRTSAMLMSVAGSTVYNQGQVHVRGADPKMLSKNVDEYVTLRGQGFDANPDVVFELGSKTVVGTVLSTSCDVDVYQRVIVKVKLDPAGTWTVKARNPGEPWSTDSVKVTVN